MRCPARGVPPASAGLPASVRRAGRRRRATRPKKRRKSPRDNEPKFDLHSELKRICGVDLTTIDGVDVMTVQTFVSELGTDMSRWRTEDHLVSYLKLAPRARISGGKVISHERQTVRS